MSEWSYLAKIIKDAKKAGKYVGKKRAKAIAIKQPTENVEDLSAYNQQLRNVLDGIISEKQDIDFYDPRYQKYINDPAAVDSVYYPKFDKEYTPLAAKDLYNNLDYNYKSQDYLNNVDIDNTLYILEAIAHNHREPFIPLRQHEAANYSRNAYKPLNYLERNERYIKDRIANHLEMDDYKNWLKEQKGKYGEGNWGLDEFDDQFDDIPF